MSGFDINDPERSRTIKNDPPPGRFPDAPEDDAEVSSNPLDSQAWNEQHSHLMSLYDIETFRQRDNREQMAQDEAFYDGLQWNEDDAKVLKERGQNPMVLNVISTSINWITGTERRGRSDYKVLARRKEGVAAAERKTELLKYLDDVTDGTFKRSRSFKNSVVVGVGWMEDCLAEDDDEEIITTRHVPWREMLWDSASSDLGLSDCRYLFRTKWVDVDVANARYPDRDAVIEQSIGQWGGDGSYLSADDITDELEIDRNQSSGYRMSSDIRPRIRIVEAWYRKPVPTEVIYGSEFQGEIYDEFSPGHQEALASGGATKRMKTIMRMQCVIFCSNGILWAGQSPYRHNKFPYTPIWCYRYGHNQLPYGIVRGLRGPQEDINKRYSKTLQILSENKVIVEEGAISNINDFLKEVSRPDGVLVVKDNKINSIKISVDRDLAPAHMELLRQGIQMIQMVGGITDEMMGRTTNAKSGVAIQARQQQGMMSTAEPFDNLRLAFKAQGEKELSLVEQFFTEEKQFRITNARGVPQYITVNDGLPENDITRTKADFIIGEQDWRITLRQAASEQIFDLIAKMPPQVGIILLDLAIDQLDIPNVEEMAKRIRQINGMRDPDQSEPTPEEIEREKAQQQQQQLLQRKALLELAALEAKVGKDQADVERQKALTRQILSTALLNDAQAVGTRVTSAQNAISAAQAALLDPNVPVVADTLLKQAGYVPGAIPNAQDDAMQGVGQSVQGQGGNGMSPQQMQQQNPSNMPPEPPSGPQDAPPVPDQATPQGMMPSPSQPQAADQQGNIAGDTITPANQ